MEIEVILIKKLFVFILIAIIFSFTTTTNTKMIPDEAIRFRVIANSNSKEDQYLKNRVKNETENYIYTLLHDSKDITEARVKMNKNLENIDSLIEDTINKENVEAKYTLAFGLNKFPEKEYKGVKYEEGEYESLVITLGSGAGDNWWCVLFPPLCLLEAEESTETEYKFFVQELIDKYF